MNVIAIKLSLEMQRNSALLYPLTFRGLYYGSRLISEQILKLNKNNDYSILIPVHNIWITLVWKNTD